MNYYEEIKQELIDNEIKRSKIIVKINMNYKNIIM